VVAVWRARTGKRGGGSGQRAAAAAGRQRPGHASHGRAGVATQNRGGGALPCGAHDTVSVGNDSGTPATGRAGVAAQNRGGGALSCGPHDTVPVNVAHLRAGVPGGSVADATEAGDSRGGALVREQGRGRCRQVG
jgi:hypothetical protein